MILKGSIIPNNSIIGAMALVNKEFKEENVLIAGTPAKIIKNNVQWLRSDYYSYCKNNELEL